MLAEDDHCLGLRDASCRWARAPRRRGRRGLRRHMPRPRFCARQMPDRLRAAPRTPAITAPSVRSARAPADKPRARRAPPPADHPTSAKRTSLFDGCTFTSTRWSGASTNSTASASRPGGPGGSKALCHGFRQAAVADRPPVYEDAQPRARGRRAVGPRDEAAHPHPVVTRVHRHDARPANRHRTVGRRARAAPATAGAPQLPAGAFEEEPHVGPAQRQQRHRLGHMARLGGGRAQELAPRRNRAEQVPHLYRRAARMAGVADVLAPAVAHVDLGARRCSAPRRCEQQCGTARDRGQRLAAEPVGGDRLELRRASRASRWRGARSRARRRRAPFPTRRPRP